MINSDIFLTLAESAMESPSFFPFPFSMHLIFAVIATAFLAYRFIKTKRPYQLIMAIAVAFSLVLRIPATTRTLYYIVGLIELIMIITAFVTSIIFRNKDTSENESEKSEATE